MADKTISLKSQIAEVRRELALRRNVYARETKPKKIAENDLHMAHMAAVLKVLEWLQGENVPDNLPRPGDLLAALIYIRRLAAALVTAGAAGKDAMKKRLEAVHQAVENALQGIPLPKLEEAKSGTTT